ncbi:CHAT domain-containing protein [Pseudanabaena sp. Chao 1811]|uniref:CHAT domain-containing protein n=1 Tax=Pseudanabaena sp. Chao 1811 TaxID=2963092 RepID=UPI0022F3BB7F|nr:tetratricopeptide repeat protein [Pseudanabaena sp. Chao 1811]
MASQSYWLTFVLTGIYSCGFGLSLTMSSMTVQAQPMQSRKIEAARLFNQAIQQAQLSQFRESLASAEQALQIYQEINDYPNQANVRLLIGNIYVIFSQYDRAISSFNKSLEIARQLQIPNLEVKVLNNLGTTYFALGQYQKAIDHQQQALKISQNLSDRQGESLSLGLLGNNYVALGQYQKALDFYQQYLAATKTIGDRQGEAYATGNIGNTYAYLGQYQKAVEWLQQSLQLVRAIADRRGEAKALENLGNAYGYLNKYQQATDVYQQALVIYQQIGDRNGEATTLGNLGNTFNTLGQHQKAIEYLQQNLEIVRNIKDRQAEGATLGNLGNAYYALKQYEKALDLYQQHLTIMREIGERRGEAQANAEIAETLVNLNQHHLAIAFYKSSINITEAIRKDIRNLTQTDRQSYLATVADRYRHLADLLLKQGRVMEALQVLDLLKLQELEDYFKNIKGSDRTAKGVRLLEPEKAVSDKLLAISFDNSKDINTQLSNQILQLPQTEINKVPDYLNQIPKGTVLLYPFILGDRLEIILFSSQNLPIQRTVNITKDKLEALVAEFKSGLIDAGSEDYKEPAIALYKLLIKPIETELIQAQTILYAPDGILRYIPLSALNDGKQWLGEKYRISNLIAYTLSDFSPKPRTQPRILAGAFGGKAGTTKFGQQGLPATLKEVLAIANSFQDSITLIEDDFSRANTESKFNSYNILHFATHAEFNDGAPENSFIIFGNGDKVRLNELTNWQIPNVELIVLSACQTGVGKLGSGVEILGFGYQIQKAGAKQAIASLWSVDDAGTQALMEAFYKELKTGNVTTAEALHRAQISLIKSSQFNHPKYWSAFFAIGNGL